MTFRSRIRVLPLLVALVLPLAACDSAEERAEAHHQNALELLDAGDVDRAIVEFRNVLALDPHNAPARLRFADTLGAAGLRDEALAQYRALADQFGDMLEPRVALAEAAILGGDWEGAERHGRRAARIAPDDPAVRVIVAALDYQAAVAGGDAAARRDAVAAIRDLTGAADPTTIGRRIRMDDRVRAGDVPGALALIDAVLGEMPEDRALLELRLTLLAELGDTGAVTQRLEEMAARFPDEPELAARLLRWHVSQGDLDAAEAVLRAGAEAGAGPAAEAEVALVDFLNRYRGRDAARAELRQILADGGDPLLFGALLAGLDYEAGETGPAIAAMRAIVAEAAPSPRLPNVKTALARMLLQTGDDAGARALADEVLESDPSHVEALKLRARFLIADDEADAAVLALRTALGQEPRDAAIMALMAEAHLRNGNRRLAGDMLSRAVEASGRAPGESLAYARFLIEDNNLLTAEAVLTDALREAPGDHDLLSALGALHLRQKDWRRAAAIEDRLRRQGSPEAIRLADGLRVGRLRGQQRVGEALTYLRELADGSDAPGAAQMGVVRTHLLSGDPGAALGFLEAELRDAPDSRLLRFLKGAVLTALDRPGEAEALYRALLAEEPRDEVIWRALYVSKLTRGEDAAAAEVLDEALGHVPEGPNLLWALAGQLESAGDIAGAIGIYEGLYRRNPDSIVVANNLASLIASYDEEEAALERAHRIARRLRDSDVPAFQDTYGWIAFRRGQIDEAIAHLEPAAAGLPDDALVHYHLGMAYAAAGRSEDALRTLRRALELAGPADPRRQFARAREEIARIGAAAPGGD